MSTQVEETVKTETPATGKDAFAAARASIAEQSTDQATVETTPPIDDTTTTQPPEEAATVADQATETTNEPESILTPEHLAALPEKERLQAIKWQAKLTQESQRLAAEKREFEQRKQAEAVQAPPTQDTTVQVQTAEFVKALPEELQFLKPVFEQFGKTILSTVEGRLQPIAQAQTQMLTEAAAAETEATIQKMDATHPDWKKFEPQMMELAQKFIPTAGKMTDFEYLQTLYSLATVQQNKVEQIKETVKRINKAGSSVEPNTPGVPESRVEHTMPANWNQMTDKERLRASYEAASKGVVWKR